ncbi:MAG: C4-dicarboxylate ABC transporter permease [Tistrella sp.]|uniref:TRAP transporter large permease protein n=1 Tax=Tistrella mobilis TaxID=171437 RepID=A0A161R5I7_9PROT|nr:MULTISPECIES: TRAP transporter large permease subunit [Tistrella]KYO54362.1 C4-dicarboxylate ABC transporter permease [Tistrella mobilis]MAD38121.1 C4-dicarboxylate ABC transporter permease [Tistrella sp.]MBA75451.1 C4-dicarboxylate ABC transporter permease [Tistrella sp.]HAE46361.1 C4-dicarboxylate ABC transporter permease [Tistrella mobilis]
MGIEIITILIVLGLLALMAIGIPLGVTTLTVSLVTAVLYFGERAGFFIVSANVTEVLHKYELIAVPFFVFMANVLERSGIAHTLFESMAILGGRFRGSVAVQTTVVAVVLAAMSGIMGGEIVMLGLIALPQMLRLGYDRKMSIGIICAAGALATLIPPSVVLIVYGLAAQVSITKLFAASAVPGLLLASLFIAYVLVRVRLNPSLAPIYDIPETGLPFVQRLRFLNGAILPAVLIMAVLGVIYSGVATVTEAAAIGAVGSLVVAAVRGELSWTMARDAMRRTALTVGSIIWLVLGAVSLIGIYNRIGGGDFLRGMLTSLDIAPIWVIVVMMAIVMVLGTFLEWIAILFITVPIFAPVVQDLGYDPVWFGVLFAMNIQIYYLSPPFGPACFFLKSVAPKDVELQEIFAAVMPFIALQAVGLLLVLAFPDIALWLPSLVE